MILTHLEPILEQKLEHLRSLIGNTPLYPIQNVFNKPGVKIYAKLEWWQIGESVKSRPAFNIISNAINIGHLGRQQSLLDASSGNTAIAYASIAANLNIPVTICLPQNASQERKDLLDQLGAKIVYTSKFGGTDEAQQEAKTLYQQDPDRYFYADQYNNPHNWRAHYNGTGEEIFLQTNGTITHFVAGLGTTGTFTGTGRKLKELQADIKLISLQPDTALHSLEGWKHLETAKVPGIFDPHLADQTFEIDSVEAISLIKEVAKKEGILISPSSAANLLGAMKVAQSIDRGTIVTVFPDSAEKYGELLKTLL
ncbi:MAG: PLP-dependent cysteine synthase family protein [Cyclobacteriaceae bacterium]